MYLLSTTTTTSAFCSSYSSFLYFSSIVFISLCPSCSLFLLHILLSSPSTMFLIHVPVLFLHSSLPPPLPSPTSCSILSFAPLMSFLCPFLFLLVLRLLHLLQIHVLVFVPLFFFLFLLFLLLLVLLFTALLVSCHSYSYSYSSSWSFFPHS